MRRRDTAATKTAMLVLLLAVASCGALWLAGCGGQGAEGSATSAPAGQGGDATATAAPTAEEEAVAAYAQTMTGLTEPVMLEKFATLFTEDARVEDRAYGATSVGRDEISSYYQKYFGSGLLSYRPVCLHSGSGCAAVESVAHADGVNLPTVEVLRLDGSLISSVLIYYYDGKIGRAPAPLQAPPGAADTAAASLRAANQYLSALRDLDTAALAPLYADGVVYRDTAYARQFVGAAAAVQAHAAVFAMKGVRYTGDDVLAGPGWAVVLWRRTDQEGRQIAYPDLDESLLRLAERPTIAGATVLEIRGGRIARETVYCDHLRTLL